MIPSRCAAARSLRRLLPPPAITSANATTFTVGSAGTFTVTTTGLPTVTTISETGALPSGVTFVNNGNGTAMLTGTARGGTAGIYSITLTGSNGVLPNATQTFTLTVNQSAIAGTFTQVTSGTYHTCGLKSDGTVACWGQNFNGETTPPPGTFTQVSAGNKFSCGLKSDGTITCWGDNTYGQATPPTVPDLVEIAISNPPATAAAGDSFSVTDTGKNQGGGFAAASTTQYYLSLNQQKDSGDILLTGSRSVPSLTASGTSSTTQGTVTVTIPGTSPVGTYYVLACADDLNAVAETSENNNCIASTGTVAVTLPDLLEIAVSKPPVAIAVGGNFSVTDTVKNQGLVPAGGSTTRYYLSLNQQKDSGDIVLAGRLVPSLTASGASSSSQGTVTVTIPSTTTVGTYYLLACADDFNAVAETNETNNCIASTSRVYVQ